ncbi:hypothetical protein [Smaragdicoccus niigatensis]|uniref:hypothetical protein n=1 Tax=Smaragdicoccus niigatensis TaxID=359359 RepID=UPI00037E82A3|nr:hypothetical protein [Smaragdicoccus niigatensis]
MIITTTRRRIFAVPTTTLKISNYTDQTMWLVRSDNANGHWVGAPREALDPGQTEIVTAVANTSSPTMPISISYDVGETGVVAHFNSANNYLGANTYGSGVVGDSADDFKVAAWIDSGVPNVYVGYILAEAD